MDQADENVDEGLVRSKSNIVAQLRDLRLFAESEGLGSWEQRSEVVSAVTISTKGSAGPGIFIGYFADLMVILQVVMNSGHEATSLARDIGCGSM